jgi:hypothetical protein
VVRLAITQAAFDAIAATIDPETAVAEAAKLVPASDNDSPVY